MSEPLNNRVINDVAKCIAAERFRVEWERLTRKGQQQCREWARESLLHLMEETQC